MVDINFPTTMKAKTIPIVTWSEIETYLNNPESYTANEHIFAEQALSDKTFAVTLPDSSMEPYFPNGSLLILDPCKSVKDRCFVLAKIAESHTLIFRQLLIDGEYKYLKPLNPDLNKFPMRLLKEEDSLLGVMIEFRHRYENL